MAFEKGKGAPKDQVQSEFWYPKAVEQGNAAALLTLGDKGKIRYFDGRELPNDTAANKKELVSLWV